MEHKLHGLEASEAAMIDDFEESNPARASESVDHDVETDMIAYAQTRSYGTRLRMIILLSLICWALVIAGVALVAG